MRRDRDSCNRQMLRTPTSSGLRDSKVLLFKNGSTLSRPLTREMESVALSLNHTIESAALRHIDELDSRLLARFCPVLPALFLFQTTEVLEFKRHPENFWNKHSHSQETMTAFKCLHTIRNPPEAEIVCPETHFESSLAKKHTIRAMSSTVPSLCSTAVAFICLSTSSLDTSASMSDSTGPGATALTVCPASPSSWAKLFVIPSMAALDAA